MPYIGSAPLNINNNTLIDHKEYLGSQADISTNSGFYTFVANYTPDHVSVIVRGINLAKADYVATNGTDIRISTSALALQDEDVIEIIGHDTSSSQILERSDIHLTGGQATNMEKISSKTFMNPDSYALDLTVPSGHNAFLAGPVNFTGTLNIQGRLNVI